LQSEFRFNKGFMIILLLIIFSLLIIFLLSTSQLTLAQENGEQCLSCHEGQTPNIIDEWEKSKHSKNGVGCYTCHQAKKSDKDAQKHYDDVYISPIVSPKDCSKCHSEYVEEFNNSLHEKGAEFVIAFEEKNKDPNYLAYKVQGEASSHAGCEQCHGSRVKVLENGKLDPTTWPNTGIGRINPDGSRGSCSACHTRHTFSIEESRRAEACYTCHVGPDHPQKEIYQESKHGAIYSAEGDKWNWTAPVGEWGVENYRAPTCATCHMSGLGDTEETHNISERLSWELETPLSSHTDNWKEERSKMKEVCRQCHSSQWVDGMYAQADAVVELYNEEYYKPVTETYNELKERGLITKKKFDEAIDYQYFELWHHEGRRARMGAFMQGPDYVQWHGFYELAKNKAEFNDMVAEIKTTGGSEDKTATESLPAIPYLGIGIAVLALLAAIYAIFK